MGFTKNKGLSIVVTILVLVLFNITAFLLPCEHTVLFWMGYGFATFSCVLLNAIIILFLGKLDKDKKFLGLSSIYLGWIYFIVQVGLSIYQMTNPSASYIFGIITDAALACVFSILLIILHSSSDEISRVEKIQAEKTFNIKSMQVDVELLSSNDKSLSMCLHNLSETIRFSDPMSHSHLAELEFEIIDKIKLLKNNLNNIETAIQICDEIKTLLKERNQKCKLLKNVPEDRYTNDNSGVKYVALSFGIISFIGIAVLVVLFMVIPNNKYSYAIDLYNEGRYEESILAFGELGTYKDSELKIESAKEQLIEIEYNRAEDYYKNQDYTNAFEIYSKLGNYKNSKNRIEQINNQLAQNNEIYFGMYKSESVTWKILKTEKDRILLITANPIEILPFNDEIKNITWETSSIRKWLNDRFLEEFSEEQIERILLNPENNLNDEIFILTAEEYIEYNKHVDFATTENWWLSTKTDSGMKFVYADNEEVDQTGESVIRAMGVRPCVWISLE